MSQSGMWLEIRRGKTNFPLRPISGDRFLIGAGSHCHLQLGGDHVPMLHSLLVIEGQKAHLEVVISEPPLVVNGEICRMVELTDEDTVSIGDFEFIFHSLVALEPVPQTAAHEFTLDTADSEVEDLSRLSAAELVELIEEEARLIFADNRNRQAGAAALVDAARRESEARNPASVSMAAFRSEPPTAAGQPLSAELAEREAALMQRANELLAAQQELASQMAEFAKQIVDRQTPESRSSRRASA